MQYLLCSFFFALLYIYLGLGLTLLLCPRDLKKHAFFLSPIVGYCYLTLVGWFCYNLDLKGSDVYAPYVLILPAAFLFYPVPSRRKHSAFVNSELIIPFVIGVVTFVIISQPLLTSVPSLTSMSLGNNDIANSASVARYLKEFSRSETVSILGDKTAEFYYVPHVYFGPSLSTALPSSLFSLEAYQLQNIGIHVFFLFSVLLFYSLAREIFHYHRFSAIMVTGLYSMSPIMYYTAYQGFQSQIIATGLAMGLILLHLKAFDSCHTSSDYCSYIPLGVLLAAGMLFTYRHILPLVYIPIGAYVFLRSVSAKPRKSAGKWFLVLAVTVAMASLFSPSRALALPSYLMFQNNVPVGWHMPLIVPADIVGLTFNEVYPQTRLSLVRIAVSILLASLAIAGVINVYKSDRSLFLLVIGLLLPVIMGYIALAIPKQMESGWGGYRSYKWLSFFLPQVLLGSLMWCRNLRFAPTPRIGYLMSLSLVVVLGCSCVACNASVRQMSRSRVIVNRDLVDLKAVEKNPRVESVNILGADFWETLWQGYFLMRKKLYLENSTYYGRTKSGLDGQWNLRSLVEDDNDVIHVSGFSEADEIIPVNGRYVLEKNSDTLVARLGKGWHRSERTHIWTGNMSNEASVIVRSPKDKLAIDLRVKYYPLDPNNRLSIQLNGSTIMDCPHNDFCEVDGVVLSAGPNLLIFKPAFPPTIPNNGDPRRLGYAVKSIEIRPSGSDATAHGALP